MADLYELLERESERFPSPVGMAERMFERGRRRARTRRFAALGVSAVLFAAILAIIRVGLPGGSDPRPATPEPLTADSVAGTYVVRLRPEDPGVQLLHMQGSYEMRLFPNGRLELTSPRAFDLPGEPISFEISEGELTTDALVGSRCEDRGTYRMSLEGGALTLVPTKEPCELRRILLSSRPWMATVGGGAEDPLEGTWTATFSCEQMVDAVRRAPVAPEVEAFWKASLVDRYAVGPTTPEDLVEPCQHVPEPLSQVFRFADGRLQIFDPPDLEEGFDGRYLTRGDVITISDGSGRNIAGQYEVRFRIDGDRVRFDLIGRAASDAFFVAAWGSAPFARTR